MIVTDLVLIIAFLFLGVLIRFSIPFLLKIYNEQITFRDVDVRYIFSATVTFVLGLGWEVIFKFTSLSEPVAYLYAFIFGVAGHEGLNWVVKAIEYRQLAQDLI